LALIKINRKDFALLGAGTAGVE